MKTLCTFKTFRFYSHSGFDRACGGGASLWLYAGFCVEGVTPRRIRAEAAVCATKCGHTCRPSAAGCVARSAWDYLPPAEVVAFSMLPYCAG